LNRKEKWNNIHCLSSRLNRAGSGKNLAKSGSGYSAQNCAFQGMRILIATLIKKKTKFSSYVYKEIQKGSVAKSYVRKPFLIYDFATATI
jgi:hypothetical protein